MRFLATATLATILSVAFLYGPTALQQMFNFLIGVTP